MKMLRQTMWYRLPTPIVCLTHSTWDHTRHQRRRFWGPFTPPVTMKTKAIGQYWTRLLDGHYILRGEHTNMNGRHQSLDGAYDSGIQAAGRVADYYILSTRRAARRGGFVHANPALLL